MRGEIYLNNVRFPLVRDKSGAWLWQETERPSQVGDPGGIGYADWRVDGCDLNGFDNPDGYLGRDYGVNTDGRNDGYDTLGPLITQVTLSTYDTQHNVTALDGGFKLDGNFFLDGKATVSNVDGAATLIPNGSATMIAYLTRGSGSSTAAVNLTTMTAKQTGLNTNTIATDIISTTPADRTVVQEISVGLGDSDAYEVLQASSATSANVTDTWAVNTASQPGRVFGQAPDRAVVMYANNGVPTVLGVFLTGTTTMKAPNWATVTTITSQPIVFTGFALDGDLWVIGTDSGPFLFDPATLNFYNLLPETTKNTENLRQMITWFAAGVIMPFVDATRQQRFGQGVSWGVENFTNTNAPVSGYETAAAASQRWLYAAIYNAQTGDTYLTAWKPPKDGDPPGHLLMPYTIAKFTGLQCRKLLNVGRANGNRTNDTLIGGYGSNMFYMTIGRTSREIDDANYLYATSGTTYATEHRTRGVIADIESVDFETENCSANRTVQMKLQINNSGSYINVGSLITTSGAHRALAVDGSSVPLSTLQGATRIKLAWDLATNTSASAPRMFGNIRVNWRWRPVLVKDYEFTVQAIFEEQTARMPSEVIAALNTAWSSGPVPATIPTSPTPNTTVYLRLNAQSATLVADTGGEETSSRGLVFNVACKATTWQTS